MELDHEAATPDYMRLPQIKFKLSILKDVDNNLKEKLLSGIISGNMTPYYKKVCDDLGWELRSDLVSEMSAINEKTLKEMIEEEETSAVSMEEDVGPKLWQDRLEYLCSIGDVPAATEFINNKLNDAKEIFSARQKFELILRLFRLSYFDDANLIGMRDAVKRARDIIETTTTDWTSRNRLSVYEALYLLSIRKFDEATTLLVDCLPTFECYELLDFPSVVQYTVLSSSLTLTRQAQQKRNLGGSVSQVLCTTLPLLKEYVESLYDCRYGDFMRCLGQVYEMITLDPLLHAHANYYRHEMQLKAFAQQLTAYRSLRIDAMAQTFNMDPETLENEIARLITAGRLPVKIDKVAGCFVRPICDQVDAEKTQMYQETIRKGDLLLNRIKKLARIVDF